MITKGPAKKAFFWDFGCRDKVTNFAFVVGYKKYRLSSKLKDCYGRELRPSRCLNVYISTKYNIVHNDYLYNIITV